MTTHDDLYQDALFPDNGTNLAAKEVLRYRQALLVGFASVSESGLLTTNHILDIQRELEQNDAGFRRLPGTTLRNSASETICLHAPPEP